MFKKKILLIDDEVDFGRIVKMNLELLDDSYDVSLARNGKEGVKKAISLRPHLIILDILMPHMNGFEVIKRLKENDKTSIIPVVMLTAKADEESKIMAAQLFNEDYVTKPIEAPELKEKIDAVLKRTQNI
ncbi:MAG: response regulator [Candidatus Omnitrophica bacterium]|nr:response regulator [Candidatus Omnitrophota bacterium]